MKLPTIVLSFLLLACRPTSPPPEAPIVVTEHDAGGSAPVVSDGGHGPADATADASPREYAEPVDGPTGYLYPACASSCLNLLRVGCPEGRPRPGEDSCYVVCKRAEMTSGRIDFKPRCIAAAHDRAAVRACGTYRCLSP